MVLDRNLALWDQVHAASAQGFAGPACLQADAQIFGDNGLVLVKTGLRHAWFNVAFRTNNELSGAYALQRAAEVISPTGHGFTIFARDWADQDLIEASTDAGLSLVGQGNPYMVINTANGGDIAEPPGIELASGCSTDLARGFAEVGVQVFPADDSARTATKLAMAPENLVGELSHLIVAYRQQLPVAAAWLWLGCPIAWLSWVAVLPDFRRQGLATLVVDAALKAAHSANVDQVALHTSTTGRQLWEQYGFATLGTVTKFRLEAAD